MSLLPESVVQAGWTRTATIQGQLDPCGQYRGPHGRRVWASAGAYSSAVHNAPGFTSDNGTPFGGTFGLDYQTADGWIFGAAFTCGSQSPEFSTGGHFGQVDEAPSLYAAYAGLPWWGNAVLTYDLFQIHTTRLVPLGIYTDQNDGNTDGQSLAVALRGGRDFQIGRLTTGPVAGLVVQQAHVDGFTESGLTGVTALAFGDQTRDSLVTQLGWRVCVGGGDLRPFAEMNWNHECAAKHRTMAAALTTIEAPSYSTDAVPVVSDWATSSLGAYYVLTPRVMLRGAASAMFINPQMTTVGGDMSLSVGF
jgi:outer membrane lipase/esterase